MSTNAALAAPDSTASPGRRRSRLALRIWHRLLSAGSDDVAELRGWDRLSLWRSYRSARERRRAVVATLKLPLRAVREALADVRAFGAEVAAAAGVSRRRQLAQLWWLKVRYGITGTTYIALQLYRDDRRRRAGRYVQVSELVRVGRYLNARLSPGAEHTFWDRRPFEALCREHNIRTVPTLLEIADGRATDSAMASEELPPCDLFSKPTESYGGEGAARWLYDGQGGYVGRDGRTRTAAGLWAELSELSRQPGPKGEGPRAILVKPCVRNHQALLPLTPGGLCTARMHTCRYPGAAPQFLLGVYKMPVDDSPADNFRFGGVAAPIDAATGRLGPAVFKVGSLLTTVTHHPSTGARIEGVELPWWREAVTLAVRAHAVLPAFAMVGWDVALLEDGPAIIEGNSLPSALLAQEASGTPLGDTALIACLNAHLRRLMGV